MTPYALNRAKIAVVVAFALSCFGILLYLWSAFGGTVPLRPAGYRVTVGLPESDLLTAQADVRISGVSVGHVVRTVKSQRSANPNRKDAVLEIRTAYAPLADDIKATIRRKSLAGEMYLELTPGSVAGRRIPDGGRIAEASVAPSVELDEVFRAFDPETRERMRVWLGEQGLSIGGRGRDLSDALGNSASFEREATQLLAVLHSQEGAVRQAVRGTGEVFDALAFRRDALRGLIVNGRRATDSLARQDRAFADTWRAFPAFETESRKLLATADAFARRTDPVVRAFQPAWRAFGEAMQEVRPTAPELKGLLDGAVKLEAASPRGLPAARRFIDELRPLVAEFSPFLQQFAPIVGEFGANQEAVSAFFANTTAITNGLAGSIGSNRLLHYARGMAGLNPESLSAQYKHRLPTNRGNPYGPPGVQIESNAPLPVFDSRACGPDVFPTISGTAPEIGITADVIARINKYALNDGRAAAPPCVLQRTPSGKSYNQLLPLSPNR